MIAIGGAIGTGLFLGAGGRLATTGPSLIFIYLLCGVFVFLVLRALGELIMHRPTSGSFTSYAREFYGEKMAFIAGWMYWGTFTLACIMDSTAIAVYLKFWAPHWSLLADTPQWILALGALSLAYLVNILSVKVFGELEFWFSIVKVAALVIFMIIGIAFLVLGGETDMGATGFSVISSNGGFFPGELLAPMLALAGVATSYGGSEMIGLAAGETTNPRTVVPRAVNSVLLRIALFYVGSVAVLTLLLPYSAYSGDESPFVTFFSHIGNPNAAATASSIMNVVVLTAAFSAMNAAMYSNGRTLRSMALNGSAPSFTTAMTKQGVPAAGITFTALISLLGVLVNVFFPSKAFEIVFETAAIGVMGSWSVIVLCQIKLHRLARSGKITRPTFRLIGAPFTAYLTLGFLVLVFLSLALSETGRWVQTIFVCGVVPTMIIGWFLSRKKIAAMAQARQPH
ncbi:MULTISPECIES: amino acid permease [unclassified Rhodococcus (in: high G+C Gram-positive bacteria)]|uniref:amino acid permease n=1 Tax=unclassified Rhodococcus (in: high G+C Gram-positive bacteria) TaxID=192944 RepID=UPI00215CCF4E|nr:MULTISPECIES: amino acid permease [unclassified Rhodococcus (in: high G+C Gram-positive bacteria)]